MPTKLERKLRKEARAKGLKNRVETQEGEEVMAKKGKIKGKISKKRGCD